MQARHHLRRCIAAAALLPLPAIASIDAPARAQELGTCFGQPATIVGTGHTITGTDGPDVVITNGAVEVTTLGGDDLVCVTGRADNGFYDTGPGSDRVDSSAVRRRSSGFTVILGGGDDQMIGGARTETVLADNGSLADADRDLIFTGSGRDFVRTGGVGAINRDAIHLGDGNDEVSLLGDAAQADISGGRGRDTLDLVGRGWPRTGGQSWKINNRRQVITRDTTLVASFTSFTKFGISRRWPGPLTFVGSRRREYLTAPVPTDWEVDVRMGPGNDLLATSGGAPKSRFDGGAGIDTLRHFMHYDSPPPPDSSLFLDMASGRMVKTQRGNRVTQTAPNFEDASFWGSVPTTVWGTHRANRISKTQWVAISIHGRGGDDRMRGGRLEDTLIGGSGRDAAFGGRGFDHCEAESRNSCEA